MIYYVVELSGPGEEVLVQWSIETKAQALEWLDGAILAEEYMLALIEEDSAHERYRVLLETRGSLP